jgi:hypothetical protein
MQNRYVVYILKEAVEISIIKRWRYYLRYQASIPTKRPQIYAQNSPGEGGRDQLLKDGQQLKEVERFSNIEGYAIFESDSMDKVLGMINAFFPFYSQEIHEIIPWEKAKEAILASARMNASRV